MALTLNTLVAVLAAFGVAVQAQNARQMAPAEPGLIRLVQTAMNTDDRLSEKPVVRLTRSFVDEIPAAAEDSNDFASVGKVTLSVDRRVRYQDILGFGGAFTEAAALTVSQMKPELQEEIINAYYGPEGIQYNVGRVPLGSCDFSTKTYTYDDIDGDFELKNFNISNGPDEDLIIPMIQRAQQRRNRQGKVTSDWSRDDSIRLFASPWSPPAWMKKNNKSVTSSFPNGLKPGEEYEEAYALYFSKFLSAYKERGVDFWAVTCQNEPLGSVKWESCNMTPDTQRNFVGKHLGPILSRDHPGVKIIIGDDQKPELGLYTSNILDDPVAKQYVSGAGFHWYQGDSFLTVARAHELHPQIFLLGTEACEGYLPWAPGPKIGNWKRGEHYGHDILGDLNHWANGWTDWNLVLNEKGGPNHLGNFCDALIIADTVNQKLIYQPSFFYMGHFSKFLPRGSIRIFSDETSSTVSLVPPAFGPTKVLSSIARDAITKQNRMIVQSSENEDEATPIIDDEEDDNVQINGLGDSGLEYGAFQTPEQETVVIVLNRNDKEYDLTLKDAGYKATVRVPKRSIQTWIYKHPDLAA